MKRTVFYILLIVIPFALALVAYFFLLPDQIPVQLTTSGMRYASKAYIFIFAVAPAVLYFGFKRKHR